MAGIAFVEDIPDPGARDHYEAILVRTRLREAPPEGLIVHAAGPTEHGWRIVAVWESEDDLIRFRDERLLPAVENAPPPARASTISFLDVEVRIPPGS